MKKLALVRGKFLNAYEMQIFKPLMDRYDITAFGSLTSYHSKFAFPTVKLLSPMDLPEFPLKMPILNRIFTDAHYLVGLEENLKGFDIVHSAQDFYHYTQQALNAKKKGYVKKVVATILENIPFNNESIAGRKAFKERFRKEIDHCIALTERSKAMLLLEGMDEKKITVVSHGIDTKVFIPRKNFLTYQKEKKKNFTILFSGRLEVYKGIFDVLYAAKLLLQDTILKEYTLHFIFVGEGSAKEAMVVMEKRLGIEKFVLHTKVSYDDMSEQYKKADIFIAPSKPATYWQEQYCTVLLEAQAVGLPIVTTLTGGIPENIGDAGTLVGSGDYYALYKAIKTYMLYADVRVKYAKKARERAEKVHDVEVIATKLDGVYKNL